MTLAAIAAILAAANFTPLRDSEDHSMDAAVFNRGVATYHIDLGNNTYAVRQAHLENGHWRYDHTLSTDESMPVVRRVRGGWVVATESGAGTGPHLRLRAYHDDGRTEQRDLPRTLSPCAEGTPEFERVAWRGDLTRSTLVLSHHYYAGCRVDRIARGRLDRGVWRTVPWVSLRTALLRGGYRGKHGQRTLVCPGTYLVEAQPRLDESMGSWSLVLVRLSSGRIRRVRLPGSWANPRLSGNLLTAFNPGGLQSAITHVRIPCR